MSPRAALLVLGLAACGPIPVEQAEKACLEPALLAQHPRGTVRLGAGSGGGFAEADVTISTDYLMRRDPAALFNSCVKSRSGQAPTRPLYDQPGWSP